MLNYQELTEVDGTIRISWKLVKYSIVKAAIFEEAQEAQDLKSKIVQSSCILLAVS